MQGQSDYTWFKEQRFAPILSQSLRISKAASVRDFAYYHVDLNAGSGMNTKLPVPVPGSPINFLRAVDRVQRPNFYAFFVDRDLACIRTLIQQPEIVAYAKTGRVELFPYDNREALPVMREFIKSRESKSHYAMGSILIDPNGYHEGIPWDALRTFCFEHPRFDLIMNLNIRTFVLERAQIERGAAGWTHKQVRPISKFRYLFHRPNWMLTEPLQINGSRWVQAVGRTIRTVTPGYASLGFYDIESDRGRDIVSAIEQPSRRVARASTQLPLLCDL